ncbi:MAG: CoA transferase [Deltaproteobacteria bacterium]|nr:MAG: CoA transferase [Deltaproteobacteria bacterium]
MSKKLLEGIKILDFSRVIVGPLTTKTLADYGAEVIKIESRKALDFFRSSGTEPDLAAQFTQWSTNKLSVTLDLTNPKAVEIAKKLVAWADIVVENYAGGVIDKLGLGYEELKKVKPDIIMLSSCMQGQTGPYAKHPGWGFQLSALSGFNHITGWPDREPPELGVYTDFITPQYNVVAIIAALLYRRRTGKGQYIDSSQFETGVQFIAPLILDYGVNGRVANRQGNYCLHAAPHNAYRCRDEYTWCAINITTDEDWAGFCGIIGNPAWTKDNKFSTILSRKENEEELNRLIEEWTINNTPEQVGTMMQRAGIVVDRLPTGAYQLGHNPQGTYRCMNEDRWCAIAVFTDEEWAGFCKVIGNPAWTKDDRFSTLLARKENEEDLDRLVEEWTINHSAEEVMTLMQENGVAAGIVETGEDQLDHDPQTKYRNLFPELDHPRLGKHHAVASPFVLSKIPCELKRAPLLGEHNEYVFKEILGLTDEEVADLVVSGALE